MAADKGTPVKFPKNNTRRKAQIIVQFSNGRRETRHVHQVFKEGKPTGTWVWAPVDRVYDKKNEKFVYKKRNEEEVTYTFNV